MRTDCYSPFFCGSRGISRLPLSLTSSVPLMRFCRCWLLSVVYLSNTVFVWTSLEKRTDYRLRSIKYFDCEVLLHRYEFKLLHDWNNLTHRGVVCLPFYSCQYLLILHRCIKPAYGIASALHYSIVFFALLYCVSSFIYLCKLSTAAEYSLLVYKVTGLALLYANRVRLTCILFIRTQ